MKHEKNLKNLLVHKNKVISGTQNQQDFVVSKKSQRDFLRCPICEKGTLRKGKTKEYMFGVYLGEFPAEICSECGESYTDSETTKKIEETAKKKGIWDLSAKTKITKTGNSLAVRIPKKIVDYLNLKDGEEAYIHPEEKKIIIEAR